MRAWFKRLSRQTDSLFNRRGSREINHAAEVLLATLAERVGGGSAGLGAWDHDDSAKSGFVIDPEMLFAVAVERTESTGCTVSRLEGNPGVLYFEYGSAQVNVSVEHNPDTAFTTGSPVVRLFSVLVENFTNLKRAKEVAAELNDLFPLIGSVELMEDNNMIAMASVPSRWLTANYLVELSITLVVWVDDIDTDVAKEVGGETADVDAPDNTHGRRMVSNL